VTLKKINGLPWRVEFQLGGGVRIMKRKFKHQFHQYQESEQSPLILTELTEHKKDHDI
jgi:hypothetical protein